MRRLVGLLLRDERNRSARADHLPGDERLVVDLADLHLPAERAGLVDDVLADPGRVDLTAHVDFGRIAVAGESAGLKTECLETQRRFLTWIMAETLKPGVDFGEWTQSRVRQFQTLTHPQHLGHSFRVIVQGRGRV
jgi:SAM-dependent MidA family methyltransferase